MICLYCDEPITVEEAAAAVPIAQMTADGVIERWQHRACALRQVVGSVAHQQRRCSCYSGTASDDESLTRRQAAEAALAYWEAHGRYRTGGR